MNTLELIPQSVALCPVCRGPLAFDRNVVVCAEASRKAMNPETRLGDLCGWNLRERPELHRAFAAAAEKAEAWKREQRRAA
jgi:predicted amidophosphoribosyltransferase